MRRAKALILAALFAASAFGCGGKNEAGGKNEGGKSASSGGNAPSQPANKDIYVDKYKIGRTQMSNGEAGTETDTYQAGESVYMSMVIRNLPSPSKVRIVYTSMEDNKKISEVEKMTDKDGAVSFELKETKALKPGTYRAEYYLANEGEKPRGMGTHDFKIVASR